MSMMTCESLAKILLIFRTKNKTKQNKKQKTLLRVLSCKWNSEVYCVPVIYEHNSTKNTLSNFNPNLPDPVNFVPFETMRYSLFDINLIYFHEHNLHMICMIVFVFISE